ncbi:rod shape-determining protein MreD [Aquihabitans sp. G128]|uniref:rod shape-determining protein MreD n=1 Tax=Aquihabitans sp. G128 TaxID=2849779 RepID=UPI001C2211C3|nr:rod shape-determining protein MreD [Aquihabitans sp. G128]QXC62724.1 rod shape-determining protein MreD [Aquihabitans sp. G128]
MSAAKVAPILLVGLLLQVCLFGTFSFDGARPDLMVLVAILAGLAAGPEKGAVVGFAAGLAFDVVLATPFGLSAFVYTIVGYGAGVVGTNVVRSAWWITPAFAAVCSALAMVFYALVGEVLGQATLSGPPLTSIVVVVALVNAVLAWPVAKALSWARTDEVSHRRHPFLAR